MIANAANCEQSCPRKQEIVAFLDDEFDLSMKTEFERHLSICSACHVRLNEQKRFLSNLDFAFDREKNFELPPDFAKKIVISAESTVSGLREPKEQQRALFIAVGLFLFGALVCITSKQSGLLTELADNFIAQITVVVGLISTLCYNLSVGLIIVLRALGQHFGFGSPAATIFFAVLLIVSLATLSHLLIDYHQASKSQ